ncbi:protein-tyrosine-phosphatase [Pelotomaculum thermopropionicum SI]|uniref:Protein-tyrosine-phosphatase n=1 Tax=Pelotomaculum thermopropionicum (strain DSM 13744 / JCM 10971 / SI) TaxID=370438 RepID=A5CYB9_PELTS|nr:protein-tyrosine-phosphatase [Pelotomaculum thermopropionicum SI]
MKILFVCTGNTCRSSMAEAIARKVLEDRPEKNGNIEVSSAGVAAWPGDRATREAVEALAEMGVDLGGHRAARLTPEAAREADLILTMTGEHRDYVVKLVPEASGKVFTLAEYAGSGGDVPDPFGQPLEAYRNCARVLESLIEKVLDKLGN